MNGFVDWLYGAKRWMYRGGRQGFSARVMNRLSALQYSAGVLSPARAMTLEVLGRRSGRVVCVPVVVVDYDGARYLVSMLGNEVNWVRNVRAADGRAVLRRGHPEPVRLLEVATADRAPVLRRYVAVAPGARPHIPLGRDAPLSEFDAIAGRYPVFRITPDDPSRPKGHGHAGRC
ncbi:nitroreductase/quinone reductase family protein [Mycobacterium sp. E3247]|uniref:nitroreductase/quinone reductase family protein n=1 Tax=Mycobacterium sp. E3247 TaxID=1856864 RepID=UPI000A44BC8D|nr:nitroreductase/quinone reductase family protein [Mycobacterium sp. E3247]